MECVQSMFTWSHTNFQSRVRIWFFIYASLCVIKVFYNKRNFETLSILFHTIKLHIIFIYFRCVFRRYLHIKCFAKKLLMLRNMKEATDLQLVDLSEHLIILVSFYYICLYTNGNHVLLQIVPYSNINVILYLFSSFG